MSARIYPTISLTPAEILQAGHVGVMRQTENIKLGRKNKYGADPEKAWTMHVEGALGECAVAKYLGVYWGGKGVIRAPDVGENQVRQASKDNYSLILHSTDDDNRCFWLPCGTNGVYSINGFLLGRDGKLEKYWKDPKGGRPAFFVPQSALHPPEHYWGIKT